MGMGGSVEEGHSRDWSNLQTSKTKTREATSP
jgi:hypothetical protein